jgi:hypothetical protein
LPELRQAGQGEQLMAQIFPDVGLDIVLGQMPKNATRLTSTFLGLFTSQTASTVITHTQTGSNITETSYTSYAQQTLATATWGAQAEYLTTLGRVSVYPQVTFPTVGTTGAVINGFFILSTNAAPGATNIVAQANFDDVTAVTVATNDVIKVTPSWVYLH